jgi:O-antigen/teichoic acid export membrane protein
MKTSEECRLSGRNGTKPLPACSDAERDLPKNLASGGVLIRSTAWNFLGQAIPLFVAILVLPVLVARLGIERFGVLMLVWMAIGYFSVLDLGLGRALTQIVARRLGEGAEAAVADVMKTGLMLMGFASLAGASLIWAIAPWLAKSGLHIPIPLQEEMLNCLYLIAVSVPFIVTSSGLTGILAAYQRFDIINWVRMPMAVLTILLPVAVTAFTVRLEWIAAIIVVTRLVGWIAYLVACAHVVPRTNRMGRPHGLSVREFVRLGGWMTLSNLLNPFLVYMDRFVIAGFVSVVAVAYYATPYELITKLWIVPGAIVGTLFPAFAATFFSDKKRASFLLAQGTKYVFLALFPLTVGVVIFSDEALGVWLGREFAANSSQVLQILAVGVLINSLVHPAAVLVQGAGRPDKVAKLHLIELPLYLPVLWYLTVRFGIGGAAVAWTLRVAIDAALLYSAASLLLPSKEGALARVAFSVIAVSGVLVGAFFITGSLYKIVYYITVMGIFLVLAWHKLLLENERTVVGIQLLAAFRGTVRK